MSKPLTSKEKTNIMVQTANHLVDMIQTRLSHRIQALNTLSGSPMDNIPDEVKKMREIEAAKIRAVMEEQKDLIEIIKLLFPSSSIPIAKEGKSKGG
jgi:hypothetical protein